MSAQFNFACGQQTFDQKVKSLYRNSVPLIKAQDVMALKADPNKEIVLLDVRSEKEFAVSHIEGARFIDYDRFTPEAVEDIPPATEVVVYCAIGYRSERIGERMKELGFENVYNLYGGIFDWKNTGHEVLSSEGTPTDSVHTYNKRWAKWLYKGLKVYE